MMSEKSTLGIGRCKKLQQVQYFWHRDTKSTSTQ